MLNPPFDPSHTVPAWIQAEDDDGHEITGFGVALDAAEYLARLDLDRLTTLINEQFEPCPEADRLLAWWADHRAASFDADQAEAADRFVAQVNASRATSYVVYYDEKAAGQFLVDRRADDLDDGAVATLRDNFGATVANDLPTADASWWLVAADDEADEHGRPLYWSNTDGWTDRHHATRFGSASDGPPQHYNLPLGKTRWIAAASADGPPTGAARDGAIKAVKKVADVTKATAARIVDQDRPELAPGHVRDVAVVLDAYRSGRACADSVAVCVRALGGEAGTLVTIPMLDDGPTGRSIVGRHSGVTFDGIDADWSLTAIYTADEVAQFTKASTMPDAFDAMALPNPARSIGTPVLNGLPADGAGDPLRVSRRLITLCTEVANAPRD